LATSVRTSAVGAAVKSAPEAVTVRRRRTKSTTTATFGKERFALFHVACTGTPFFFFTFHAASAGAIDTTTGASADPSCSSSPFATGSNVKPAGAVAGTAYVAESFSVSCFALRESVIDPDATATSSVAGSVAPAVFD